MKVEDYGIVLSVRKFGGTGLVVNILSRSNGPIRGLVKGQKKNGNILQPGNLLHFSWQARLSEHLGTITPTLEKAYPLLHFSDYQRILGISSLCSLLDSLLPEREHALDIYNNFLKYLEGLSSDSWLQQHVLLELFVLEKAGFGLDLNRCSVSGSTDNITYISPKTGSAVSRTVGEPYSSRLFSIPSFFLRKAENQPHSLKEIIDGLEITRYFLAKHFFTESLSQIPVSCTQFHDELIRITNLNDQTGQNRDYKFS